MDGEGKSLFDAEPRYAVGDVVQMKKPHPCGGEFWEVLRVGMDFRIKCAKCGRVVMLPREKFEKGIKKRADSRDNRQT